MSPLVIDLVVNGNWFELPCFNSPEELEEYLGEETSIDFDNEDEIFDFIDKWEKDHKFSTIYNKVDRYDLEAMYAIREVVFTVDEKYYRLYYKESYAYANELYLEPYEVTPVEKTIIEYVIRK